MIPYSLMPQRKAELICTGSELVSFKNNRYVPLFSARLRALGFRLCREHSVGDDLRAIAELVSWSLDRSDLVITCGGLGPTFDDLTRQAAARALRRRLVYSKYAEQVLKFNYKMAVLPPNFKDQCLILEDAKMLENANGTAFGQALPLGKKLLLLLPGPQSEWEPMFDAIAAPEIKEFFRIKEGSVRTLRLKIADLWEVQAEKLLKPVMRRFPEADYTILAGPGTAEFAFTVAAGTPAAADRSLAAIKKACSAALGGKVYGAGDDTLAGILGKLLAKKKATLSLAESCTGGAAADAITDTPGSSAYFMGAVTAYANKAKEKILGVQKATILRHGAVSPECAEEMAEGARRLFRTDYAAAVTGIAGPGGGTEEKPVGLVHFAVSGRGMRTRTFTRRFHHGRAHIKACAVNFVLDALRKIIQ